VQSSVTPQQQVPTVVHAGQGGAEAARDVSAAPDLELGAPVALTAAGLLGLLVALRRRLAGSES
jgi:hypothetical protein